MATYGCERTDLRRSTARDEHVSRSKYDRCGPRSRRPPMDPAIPSISGALGVNEGRTLSELENVVGRCI